MAEAINKNMKFRVTTLVGAGAALEITGMKNHHSTADITKAVLQPTPRHGLTEEQYTAQTTVVNDIFNCLVQEYNKRNSTMPPLSQNDALNRFHFEILYHIIETLYAYDFYWSDTAKNANNRPPIVDFIINKFKLPWEKLGDAQKSYITTIMDVVNEYDQAFAQNINDANNIWYKNWWQQAPFIWDVFTLNYDATIENSLVDYVDGFEPIPDYDFKRFNPQLLMQATTHSVNHMHGCILYGLAGYKTTDSDKDEDKYNHRDLYKYPSFDRSINCWLGRGINNEKFQSGEDELFSPILTGLRKTDKLLHLPLDMYRWNFERKIIENNALVIVGYSFGDTYINEVINRMRLYHGDKMRVVLIDYKPHISPNNIECGKQYRDAALGRALCSAFPQAGCESILRGMNVGDYNKCHFTQYEHGLPIYSNNGQLMCCYNGFKDAVENHYQEIYDFLMR